jgi:DNA-binding MarR family transcriptional regulator
MLEPDHAEELLTEIRDLYGLVLRIARHARDVDEAMTATQRLALIDIVACGSIRPALLARRMDTTPATVTRAIDALEELNLVRRRDDPEDRRGILVEATPRGRRWAERRAELVRDAIRHIPKNAAPSRLISDLNRLNAALRSVSDHHEAVAQGDVLAH